MTRKEPDSLAVRLLNLVNAVEKYDELQAAYEDARRAKANALDLLTFFTSNLSNNPSNNTIIYDPKKLKAIQFYRAGDGNWDARIVSLKSVHSLDGKDDKKFGRVT